MALQMSPERKQARNRLDCLLTEMRTPESASNSADVSQVSVDEVPPPLDQFKAAKRSVFKTNGISF